MEKAKTEAALRMKEKHEIFKAKENSDRTLEKKHTEIEIFKINVKTLRVEKEKLTGQRKKSKRRKRKFQA